MKEEKLQFYRLSNYYEIIELENQVLLNPKNSCSINKFLVFNGTAAAILKKIKNRASINEIVDNLVSTYDIRKENEDTVHDDVINFIDKMLKLSVIEIIDNI